MDRDLLGPVHALLGAVLYRALADLKWPRTRARAVGWLREIGRWGIPPYARELIEQVIRDDPRALHGRPRGRTGPMPRLGLRR